MDKALELFSTQGYDSVSAGELAKAVGIKAPSLYNHFSSKQAIFDAIIESTAAQYQSFLSMSILLPFFQFAKNMIPYLAN